MDVREKLVEILDNSFKKQYEKRDLDANFGNAVCCPNCGAKMDL